MRFGGVLFRLQFVRELAKLVEIDTRPESKGMRYDLRGGMARSGRLAQAVPDRAIHGLLEGNAKFTRTLLQQARQVVVERQCRPHSTNVDASGRDVKTSGMTPSSPRGALIHPV